MTSTQRPAKNLRRTVQGVNDIATLRPDIAAMFSEDSPIRPHEVSVYSEKKARFVCGEGHVWEARISTVSLGGRCVYCAGLKTWSGYNDLVTKRPELVPYYSSNNPLPPNECYYAGSKKLWWHCPDCQYEWQGQARNISTQPCPCCYSRVLVPGVNDFATKTPEAVHLWHPENTLQPHEVFPFSNMSLLWQCAYNHTWKTTPNKISSGNRCPECVTAVYRSAGEHELAETLTHILIPTVQQPATMQDIMHAGLVLNDRTVLQGNELDIVIPHLGVAFEYNGEYWHSDTKLLASHNMTAYDYHAMKYHAAYEAGYVLCFVWERDWKERRDVVVAALEKVLHCGEVDEMLQKFEN